MLSLSALIKAGLITLAIYLTGNLLAFLSPNLYQIQEIEVYRIGISKPVHNPDILNLLEMYRGKPSIDFFSSRVAPDAVFEDPCMMGQGPQEIYNSFIALKLLEPSLENFYVISPSKVYLNMTYTVFSHRVQMDSIAYLEYDENDKISVIREQWNDMQLYSNALSKLIRRMNGLFLKLFT